MLSNIKACWIKLWMHYSGLSPFGRIATRLAVWLAPPYTGRFYLARLNPKGYISCSATLWHSDLHLGANVFIGDRVVLYQSAKGGHITLGNRVHLIGDTYLFTGQNGSVQIGSDTYIQPGCQFSAYLSPIEIGCGVQIAPHCAFYPYNHGIEAGKLIREQPLTTKGGIVIDDDALLGYGVIVLSGVKIGKGAVIGAGSVVTKNIPAGAIAAGVPAQIIKMRGSS